MSRLHATRALLRRWPHLPAFWPEAQVLRPPAVAAPDALLLLPQGEAPPPGWGGGVLCLAAGPFAPPQFGSRDVPAVLFAAVAEDPVRAALDGPAPPLGHGRLGALRDRLRAARLGGPPGLSDPGPPALGCGPNEAAVVLDPCDPARATQAQLLLRSARARGAAPILLRDPFAPASARPVLPGTLPLRLDPWTILDAAAELHALPGAAARIAAIAGITVYGPEAAAPLDGDAMLAALATAARCADPVRGRPIPLEDAIDLLGAWRAQEMSNRRVAVCLGMSFWKRRRIAAALASSLGAPGFARTTVGALAVAARHGGAVAAWPSRVPAEFPLLAKVAGVPLVWVEDGFIRSAGLGAGFVPAASLTLDHRRPYYDPSGPSDLELLLATARVAEPLRARAAALRQAMLSGGVTKYNLPGAAPDLPARDGRLRILVPGQVEDDLSILRGAAGAVRTNLDLLRAVRAAHPDAFIAFKPHPDVEAGYRRGAIPEAEARSLADAIFARAPIAPLLAEVDSVHTMTSLTGFEALLRGRAVTCWGQPFYAGWGLTEDRAPIARRRRRLTLDEMVAVALILYPRYLDPVTELPCTPEDLLARLADPDAWTGGAAGWLRRWQGRIMARLMPGRG